MPQSGPGASVRPSCHAPVEPAGSQSAGNTERTPVRFCKPQRQGGVYASTSFGDPRLNANTSSVGHEPRWHAATLLGGASSLAFSTSPRRSRIRLFESRSASRIRLLLSLAGALAILMLGSAPAFAADLYPTAPSSTFGSEGNGDGQFEEPSGIAVNYATGDVYVVDKGNGRVEWFNASGSKLEGQFNGSGTYEIAGKTHTGSAAPTGQFERPHSIAVDDSGKPSTEDPSVGDVYVVDTRHLVVDKFSASGEYEGQLTGTCETGPCSGEEAFEEVIGVAVSDSGDVWVIAKQITSPYPALYEFTPTGRFVTSFGTEHGAEPGLALDSKDDIFSITSCGTVLEHNPSSRGEALAEFGANPGSECGPATAVAVNPETENVVVDIGSSIRLYEPFAEPHEMPVQTFATEGLAGSPSIAVSATGIVYATEEAGEVAVFQPIVVPTVSASIATNTSETSATLHATVDPVGLPVTSCVFEYSLYSGEAGAYTGDVPCTPSPGQIGGGSSPVSVSAELTALLPGSSYDFRLAAANANGTSDGPNVLFTSVASFTSTGLGLPDDRTYELVSTIENTSISPPPEGQPESYFQLEGELNGVRSSYRAAADGESVEYVGGSPGDGSSGSGVAHNGEGTSYLAARTAHGWEAAADTPTPNTGGIFEFSSDLSSQVFFTDIQQGEGEASLGAELGNPSDCGIGGTILDVRTGPPGAPSYRALFSETINPGECPPSAPAGISADDKHILVQSAGAHTADAIPGTINETENLYDSVEGRLRLVSVLPDGQATSDATFGGLTGTQREVGNSDTGEAYNFGDDISEDGARIVWTDLADGVIYDRENDDDAGEGCTPVPQSPGLACTVQVSAGAATYWNASADGRYVFYTEGDALWRYDTSSETREAIAAEGLAHEPADIGGVLGVSEDGSYVYFVAGAVLAENAGPEGNQASAHTCEPYEDNGEATTDGTPCNLYVDHDGVTRYIATLAAHDDEFLGTSAALSLPADAGDWKLSPGQHAAEVSPNGQSVAFMSRQPLTGYDNRGIVTFVGNGFGSPVYGPVPETFVYQAGANRLSCASCDPTGALPARTAEGWEDERGGFAPLSSSGVFMPRWVNETGTEVFFETSQPLVARDTNRRLDVYEWRSEGTDDCGYARGCVSLISGGDEADDAFFVDASSSGDDVFFTSRESLTQSALGETTNVYDARVGGGFPETTESCTGTGCQGAAPAAPLFSTPPSLTFSGTGNFAPAPSAPSSAPKKKKTTCKKGFAKSKKGKCVAERKAKAGKRKRKPVKSSKHLSHDRRS